MVVLKKNREIEKMREAGRRLAEIMLLIRKWVGPGLKTAELDRFVRGEIRKKKAEEAFSSQGFPAAICTSVNEEIVHGIPGDYVIREGDILSVDIGLKYREYYADMAETFGVGKISSAAEKLIAVTRDSLREGIDRLYPANTLGDVGYGIQKKVEENGFFVVRDFVGHGIGTKLQEDPQVPNYGTRGRGQVIQEGMVLALEPMVTAGPPKVKIKKDGWTAVTADGSLAAHFEHTVAVTDHGPEVLTVV